MYEIVILVGLPASGKSTYRLKNFPNHVVVSNDEIIEEYAHKHNMDYNTAFHKVSFKYIRSRCKEIFETAVSENKNIVIDNTHMTVKSRSKYSHSKYIKKCVVFNINDIEYNRRVIERKNTTSKFVPESVVSDMKNIFVYPTKAEGFESIIEVIK